MLATIETCKAEKEHGALCPCHLFSPRISIQAESRWPARHRYLPSLACFLLALAPPLFPCLLMFQHKKEACVSSGVEKHEAARCSFE